MGLTEIMHAADGAWRLPHAACWQDGTECYCVTGVTGGGSGGLDMIQDALRAYCSSKGNRPHGQRVLEQALYKNEILVKTYNWCW